MAQPDELLYTAQAAESLGVDIRTIQRMATDGRLTPAVTPPGKTSSFLFHRSEIERVRARLRAELEEKLAVLSERAAS